MTIKASDVALEAINVLNTKGWIKGRTHDEQGRVCLVQAVSDAAVALSRKGDNSFANYFLVVDKLDDEVPNGNAIAWQDEVGRTKRQVIGLLKRTAKALTKEGK